RGCNRAWTITEEQSFLGGGRCGFLKVRKSSKKRGSRNSRVRIVEQRRRVYQNALVGTQKPRAVLGAPVAGGDIYGSADYSHINFDPPQSSCSGSSRWHLRALTPID